METQTKFIIFIVIVVFLVVGLGIYTGGKTEKIGKLDDFAKCINNSGAKFYNAFWCNHCQTQKKMFGSSSKYLPSIECSTLDGQAQTQVCKDAGIQYYPTWEFIDKERLTGLIELEVLAEKTQCVLPL
jgi:hypothetical protein